MGVKQFGLRVFHRSTRLSRRQASLRLFLIAYLFCPIGQAVAGALGEATDAATESPTAAVQPPPLRLEAVMGRKAVIRVGDKRLVLGVGERRDGLRLLRLGNAEALVERDGLRQRLRLGEGPIGTRFAPQRQVRVSIAPNHAGMYETPGAINGRPVQFLVDTGATTIAMNAARAKALGIDYLLDGTRVLVNTASGQVSAYRLHLREVTVGGIRVHNVAAVILQGGFPREVLLGMSFLGRLDIRHDGMLMELRQKR